MEEVRIPLRVANELRRLTLELHPLRSADARPVHEEPAPITVQHVHVALAVALPKRRMPHQQALGIPRTACPDAALSHTSGLLVCTQLVPIALLQVAAAEAGEEILVAQRITFKPGAAHQVQAQPRGLSSKSPVGSSLRTKYLWTRKRRASWVLRERGNQQMVLLRVLGDAA